MTMMNMLQAINQALREELQRNDQVILLGEDVGRAGGVFRVTQGLQKEFGPDRVLDTPLAENGIIGVSLGLALYGFIPVAEIQFMDFVYPGFDQMVSEVSKLRYRSGGQFPCHMVVRMPSGGGIKGGLYHSQNTESYFVHLPGVKVVTPSTSRDAKGLLKSAIRDQDPVIFLEPKRLYRSVKEEVPDDEFLIEIGKARIARQGQDVSIFTYGGMVPTSLQAAEELSKKGVDAEVMDLRTLSPLDKEAVLTSFRKTGRAVIVHEASRTCGVGAEISAIIAEEAVEYLKGPVIRVTGYDTPVPSALELKFSPSVKRIMQGVEKTLKY
jgi:2-oxoisovalerate dehydrogenase E1 component beta subunit